MCLIVFAHHAHPKYPFILLANRDEYHERPTQQMGFWEEELDLIGGRDLRAGGTWLAMNKSGDFAVVTNVRASALQLNAKSRGHLPVDFLKSPQTNQSFMRGLQAQAINYNAFNLLTRKGGALLHFNNQLGIINQVPAGIHGLCNASLNTSWPKLDQLKTLLYYHFICLTVKFLWDLELCFLMFHRYCMCHVAATYRCGWCHIDSQM